MTLAFDRTEEPKKGSKWLLVAGLVIALLLLLLALATVKTQPIGDDDDEIIYSSPNAERAAEEIERLAGIAKEASENVAIAMRDGQQAAAEESARLAHDVLYGAKDTLEAVKDSITETEFLAMQDAIEEIESLVRGIDKELLP